MKALSNFLLITLTVVAAESVYAEAPMSFHSIPTRFHSNRLSIGSRALGETCMARTSMPNGTVCNPAYLPMVRESTVVGGIFIGNGYEAMKTADRMIFKSISKEFLEDLFRNNNVTSLEANVGLAMTAQNFSAEFIPYRVQYVSEAHNPNNPEIAVHGSVERSLNFGGGMMLGSLDPVLSEFSVGARLRLLERTFVHGGFFLFEVASRKPRELLPSRKQQAIFIDPSIAWVPTRAPWKLRTTVGVKNFGKAWDAHELYPEYTDLEAGLGVEPPVGLGRLQLGIDLVDLIYAREVQDRLRFGGSYQLGMMEVMAGVNSSTLSAGLQFGIQYVQAGIVYEFIRTDINGSGIENKIATEFSVKL